MRAPVTLNTHTHTHTHIHTHTHTPQASMYFQSGLFPESFSFSSFFSLLPRNFGANLVIDDLAVRERGREKRKERRDSAALYR